jgi:hypothetical protein
MKHNATDITLTPAEKSLASRIQFDEQVLCVVKGLLGRDIEPYSEFMYKGLEHIVIKADMETEGKGFKVQIESDYNRTWLMDKWPTTVLYSLREILPIGYQAFLSGPNYHSDVTVLKTVDPYDILRVVDTHGWDFQDKFYSSEDLIGVIVEWQQEYPLNIIGAGYNNVKMNMEILPGDLVAFAEKVNFLCWELGEINGFGNYGEGEAENRALAEKLAAHLRETRRLYLWWD